MIMHRRHFKVKPKLLAPGTVNPRHELLKRRSRAVEILAMEAPWSALPDSPGLPRQTFPRIFWIDFDLFQEVCACQA